MADLQHGIGEGVSGGVYTEGSLPHALLHGAVGCAAAEALDGNCASGAAAGIAQSIFAGLQEGAPEQQPGQSDEDYAAVYNAWKNDIAGQAKLLGAVVGYTTSGGLAVNVTNAASIAESGARHNYLSHTQFSEMIERFRGCNGDPECLREALSEYRELSLQQEHEMAMCGTDLACLADHIPHLLDTVDNAEINEFLTQLQPADLADPIARQLMDQIVALQRTAQIAYGVTPQSATNGFAYSYGQYRQWSANNCQGMSGADCMAHFQTAEVHGMYGLTHMYHSWRSGVQMYTLAAGGAAIAATPAAVAAMGRCLQNAACMLELTVAIGEVSGATAGQIAFTTAVGGHLVMRHGDEIIRVIDKVGDAFVPLSQNLDSAGRLILQHADGATGYIDNGGRFVQTGGPARTLPTGSPYSQADYDAYVQRKLDAGETPRAPEDYISVRQQLDQNRADGVRRQEQYRQEMAEIYGEENVLTERYLRDADGNVVRDPDTGEGRRLDCVVVNGQCGYAVEVTSPTANKVDQLEKERSIREAGGIYVQNPNTGELIEVENTSEVIRLE